jgi:hypothetical protein
VAYPSTVPDLPTDSANTDPSEDLHPALHNDTNAEVNAIGATLGVNPHGGAATVADRLRVGGLSAALAYLAGSYIDQAITAHSSTTSTRSANSRNAFPFISQRTIAIDRLGVSIASGTAGNIKYAIYAAGSDGWPAERLWNSGDISTGSNGHAYATLSHTFQAGVLYWISFVQSVSPTVRLLGEGSALRLPLSSADGSAPPLYLTTAHTFANPLPDPWGTVTTAQFATGTPVAMRMRVV